jgi:adenine deaminase
VSKLRLSGRLVDAGSGKERAGSLVVENGKIAAFEETGSAPAVYFLPGFVDAHVHIESSMLIPTEFARLAAVHGTVGVVSDPHEIANVLGMAGVRYMTASAKQTALKVWFGAPSCVPATGFETAGAVISSRDVEELLARGECQYLSEVMNFPGVLGGDPEVMAKIAAAKKLGKRIDGHAPGMRGAACGKYFGAGITTDHECTVLEEALEKIQAGAHILIREGSAAKNFAALWPLMKTHPDRVMLCSDDKHPDDLLVGHINETATRALKLGVPLPHVIAAAGVNAAEHYGLPVGRLRVGDTADFVMVDSLTDWTGRHVLATYIGGECVAERGVGKLPRVSAGEPNVFEAREVSQADFAIECKSATLRAIHVVDGQLITRVKTEPAKRSGKFAVSDVERDVLKIAVVCRYPIAAARHMDGDVHATLASAFVHNFGIKRGAIASSVAHDSHNIVAVGVTDEDLARAVNRVIKNRGGLAAVCGEREESLPLPVAGLMSTAAGEEVAAGYSRVQALAKGEMGSTLAAPFMTLSFMALLVIPELKLSDRGLFDGVGFSFVDVFV